MKILLKKITKKFYLLTKNIIIIICKFILVLLKFFNEYIGRIIYEKIIPPDIKSDSYRKPPTIVLWGLALYFTAYGIASQRHENISNNIEFKTTAVFAQLPTKAFRDAIEMIPEIQNMPCPVQPEIYDPISIFQALFFKNSVSKNTVNLLKVVIEIWTKKGKLEGVKLSYVNLEDAELTGANFQKAELKNANFQNAELKNANFQNAELKNANFQNADLGRTKFQKAELTEANFQKAYLEYANFQNAFLGRTKFQNARLSLANFKMIISRKINFQGAELVETNFQKAELAGTNFQNAELKNANFQNAYLKNANFQKANLEGASLQKAYLYKTNLLGALLKGANLKGAILLATDLNEAKELTLQQLLTVKTLYLVKNIEPKLKDEINKIKPELFKKPKWYEEIIRRNKIFYSFQLK